MNSLLEQNTEKFLNKLVTFETSEGCYIGGVVTEIDDEDPNVLIITDKSGHEHYVNYQFRDVVVN